MHHRKTEIYRQTLELLRLCRLTVESLPPGYAFLSDQLRRASSSILLNFAEGNGKSTPKERRRFFRIAKASAYEVAAIFDTAQSFAPIKKTQTQNGADLCDHIAAMLSKYR